MMFFRFPRCLVATTLFLTLVLVSPTSAMQMHRVATVDVPGEPGFAQMAFARGMLVIAHESANRADVFDPVRRRVVAQIDGLKSPHGIAVDERGGRVYIANSGNTDVAVINVNTWKVERTIPLQAAPYNLLLSPDGKLLYVANYRAQSLSVIATDGRTPASTQPVEGSPQAMVFDAAQRHLYVTIQDRDEVAVFDSSLRPLDCFHLAASQPTGLALDAVTRRLYVAVRYAVVALNSDSGAEVSRVPAPAGANSLWLAAGGRLLYLASGGGVVDLIRIAGGAMTVEEELTADVRGDTLAYDASRDLVYLPGGRDGQAKLAILKGLTAPPAPQPNQPQVAEKHP
jgi:YVTN family beta-propeller protein